MKLNKQILLMVVCLVPTLSFATLGEDSASIGQDNSALASNSSLIVTENNSAQNKQASAYQVAIIQTPTNITIKEYSANGKVFAITWSGQRNPDLKQLFGTYFTQFKSSPPMAKSLNNLVIDNGNLIVHTTGVAGQTSGVASLPALTPANIDVNSLN